MTNFEFYKDEIMNLGLGNLGFNIYTNKFFTCGSGFCVCCLFHRAKSCDKQLAEFLYAEHEEQAINLDGVER